MARLELKLVKIISMKHMEGTFPGSGGLPLYYQGWCPDGAVRAIVAIVHGFGAHSGLFQPAVEVLVPQGYAAYAFDLRGHGRSPGPRGHINAWAEFRQDLQGLLQQVQRQSDHCSCFLWGHSLGGVIALDYALHLGEGLQGLILTAPALGKVQISPLKLALGRSLSSAWPRFSLQVSPGLRANRVAQRQVGRSPLSAVDPLLHHRGTARLATEFLATARWVERHGPELSVPLLILHGRDDPVIPAASSAAFFQRLPLGDKQRLEYPGNSHDLDLATHYPQVLQDLEDWLERHLKPAQPCRVEFPQAM
jgi:alpha-beta hydrolase superfamily lysophospholipase